VAATGGPKPGASRQTSGPASIRYHV
jgi:hypothetical protein